MEPCVFSSPHSLQVIMRMCTLSYFHHAKDDFAPRFFPQYWTKYVTIWLLHVQFIFWTMTFYRGFQALELIDFAVFGTVDYSLGSCMLVSILEINFKQQLVCNFDKTVFFDKPVFVVFSSLYAYVFAYIVISSNIILPWFLCTLFSCFK